MRLLVDAKRCVGCRLCELACSFHHRSVFGPENSDIRISFDDFYNVVVYTNVFSTCDFCGECVSICPVNAITVEKSR